MSKLHGLPPSPPTQAVFVVIKQLGWDIELTPVDFKGGAHKTPEFLALNPRGQIPTLEEDGFSLGESSAIVRYLLATRETPDDFYPADPKKRAIQDVYQAFLLNNLSGAAQPLYFNHKVGPAFFGKDPPTEELTKELTEKLDKEVANLETYRKAYGGEYLTGDSITLADV